MKVYIATKKIQALGRVVLDTSALVNAKLKIGDDITIYFDTDSSAILIEKTNKAESRAGNPPAREPGRKLRVRP